MNNEHSIWQKAYNGLSALSICALLNLLFLLGILVGLGVFGLAPSLVTTFQLGRKYHQQALNKPIRTFFHSYKENFIVANKMLFPLFLALFIVWVDTQVILEKSWAFSRSLLILLAICQIFILLWIIVASALFSQYWLTPFLYLKKGIQFIFYNAAGILLILLWTGICYYGSLLLPGLIPFFSFGLWILVASGIFLKLFENNEEKIDKKEERKEIYLFTNEERIDV